MVEARETGICRWKYGRRGVGFGLIPVGDGKEIVGAGVGVAVFDSSAERFCEWNGRIEMEAIDGSTAAGPFVSFDRRAHEAIRK